MPSMDVKWKHTTKKSILMSERVVRADAGSRGSSGLLHLYIAFLSSPNCDIGVAFTSQTHPGRALDVCINFNSEGAPAFF
jgi:hypothetical protein